MVTMLSKPSFDPSSFITVHSQIVMISQRYLIQMTDKLTEINADLIRDRGCGYIDKTPKNRLFDGL